MVLEESTTDKSMGFHSFTLNSYHLSKEGESIHAEEYRNGKPILIAFICNHCPYVKHIVEPFAKLMNGFEKDVACIAINSNDASQYPDDDPERMYLVAQEHKFHFPYCYDEKQEIAKKYKAVCTPDLFLFDGSKKLFYKGRFDETNPKSKDKATGEELRIAINDLIMGRRLSIIPRSSIGCSIKWKN